MENRNCQNCKNNFIIESDDFSFYEKMDVPPPTFCPECRMVRRLNFRNESILFRRVDSSSGKEIFSGFSPKTDIITYNNTYWYGDQWDSLSSGFDYDFSLPFFEQFKILLAQAPLPAISGFNMINSDYCNEVSELKNCYLVFNVDYSEDSSYIRKSRHIKNSLDLYESANNELCYDSLIIEKSYRTMFSVDCENCVDVWFSKNLHGCTNCFGCVNLRKKSNCIFNEQYSAEEYKEKLKEFFSGSHADVQNMKEKSMEFWLRFPVKYNYSLRVLNVTGDKIYDSRNIKKSFFIKGSENLAYCQDVWNKTSNAYDYSIWGDGAENIYDCVTCGLGIYNLKFCVNCWENARNLEYCIYCINSSDCFGCVGLYKKQYCIFNKQYSKEEYYILRDKIIAQMKSVPYTDSGGRIYSYGEFFPHEISPIAYNESLAQEFFPLEESSASQKGYTWRDNTPRDYKITLVANDIPDSIDDISDSITSEIIECESCSRPYRIIPMELQFYKKMKLPIPHKCHNCRFLDRFKFVNPLKLWHRSCMCDRSDHFHGENHCTVEFETPYTPDRPDKVYCEKCYQAEVV